MTDSNIEQEIQEKALTAPRVTPERLEEVITTETYHIFPGTTFTVCLLTLSNGFNVLGESACASPENFDIEIGHKIARANAVNKIWVLEGYLLKQQLHDTNTAMEKLNRELSKIGEGPQTNEYTIDLHSLGTEKEITFQLLNQGMIFKHGVPVGPWDYHDDQASGIRTYTQTI